MSESAVVESSSMGRPKRQIPTTSVKVEEDAAELVRQASTFLGLSVVEYVSRILREHALKDLREGAERFLRENPTTATASEKSPKKSGK